MEWEKRQQRLARNMYEYYVEHPDTMSAEYQKLLIRGEKKEQVVCDYISGMTDQYSIKKFREIYIPKAWKVF